jgi:hypothetical protein
MQDQKQQCNIIIRYSQQRKSPYIFQLNTKEDVFWLDNGMTGIA